MEAQQTILDFSRRLGDKGAALALNKAERDSPGFSDRAKAAILARLAQGKASGEQLTAYVKDCGIPLDKNGKELGAIYASLRRKGLIVAAGDCCRAHGHGTKGGTVYRLGGAKS